MLGKSHVIECHPTRSSEIHFLLISSTLTFGEPYSSGNSYFGRSKDFWKLKQEPKHCIFFYQLALTFCCFCLFVCFLRLMLLLLDAIKRKKGS